uniref:CBM_X n=2 Tax=Bacillota TaxID=1239 RepID=A0A060C9A3_9FIRM|nr:CBM_X [uncultured Caldicellulosiruptor sp.]
MKYGDFDTSHDEYVIHRPDVPVSWTNYLGTKHYSAVVSHNGGGYSYYKSPPVWARHPLPPERGAAG